MSAQRFTSRLAGDGRGGVFIEVPFDPDALWGPKSRHHVAGTVNGIRVRGVVESQGEARGFRLGPAWLRDGSLPVDAQVVVEIGPEGPQRDDLAGDVASALQACPEAAEFFDSLAQFYRRAYLRWVDATKRSPDLRAQRIATMVDLLSAGEKDVRQHRQ
jgi:hypothetical protein